MLAGIQLIFSIVAGMGLCSEFVLEMVGPTEMFLLLLIIAYSVSSPFPLLTLPTSEEVEGAPGAGKRHSWDPN